VRAVIVNSTPARPSDIAQARPNPLLAAQTSAFLPRIFKSNIVSSAVANLPSKIYHENTAIGAAKQYPGDSRQRGRQIMAMVEWRVRADEFANCNCSYGCPCQFNALPTHGFCEAAAGWKIHEGHFGDTRLDGLNCGFFVHFPGPVHEGNGTIQLIVDEKADTRQREALVKIMSGEETEEMATMWWVFSAMSPNKLEPLFVPIDFEVDVEGRRARLVIPGLLEASGEPIRNPVTGAEHRVRIDLPHGFEFRIAEIGSGTTKATGAIKLDLKNSYGQFAHLHLSNKGVVD
jgi:hypothetical protein